MSLHFSIIDVALYLLRILLNILLIGLPIASYAENVEPHDRFICGASQVEIFNSNDVKQPYFTIKLSNANRSIKLNYSVRNEFLFVRCDSDSQKKPMVLFNHHCGGSGCSETNFGIIEPQKLEVLLAPSQDMLGHYAKAKKSWVLKSSRFHAKHIQGHLREVSIMENFTMFHQLSWANPSQA